MSAVEAVVVGQFVAAAACLLVAIAVLILGRHPVHVALAGLLTMRAFENAFEAWNDVGRVPWTWYSERFFETLMFWSYALFGATFTMAFHLRWPPRKGWLVAGPIMVIGIGFAIAVATPGLIGEPSGSLRKWVVSYWALPVAFVESIRLACALLISWVGWNASRASVQRMSQFISLGIVIFSAYWAGRSLVWGAVCMARIDQGRNCTYYIGEGAEAMYWLRFIAVLATLIAWWVVAGNYGREGRQARALVIGLSTVGVLAAWAHYDGFEYASVFQSWYVVVGVLLQPVILAYAIAKYQVMGLRSRMRWTITQSSVFVVLGGSFLVVSQIAGALIEDKTNSSVIGATATLLLLVAFKPIHHWAGRLATHMVPQRDGTPTMSVPESIYSEQAEFAWADGVLSRSERVRLDRLRAKLGLSPEVAVRLEEQAAAM